MLCIARATTPPRQGPLCVWKMRPLLVEVIRCPERPTRWSRGDTLRALELDDEVDRAMSIPIQ